MLAWIESKLKLSKLALVLTEPTEKITAAATADLDQSSMAPQAPADSWAAKTIQQLFKEITFKVNSIKPTITQQKKDFENYNGMNRGGGAHQLLMNAITQKPDPLKKMNLCKISLKQGGKYLQV
jgi:hypothetical protein